MKKISVALMCVLFLGIFVMSFVLAEDNQTNSGTEQELQLDESTSGGQIAWKQVGLWFTFNQEKKIEKELELARLRLIQAKIAAKNNNPKEMEKALDAHERILEKIKNRMGKLESGKDLNSSTEKLVRLERAIQVHEKRINFMNYLLLNANLSEEQKSKIEMKISKAENVTARLSELNDEKKERIKTRLMNEKNMSPEEAQKFVDDKGFRKETRKNERKENRNDSQDNSENNSSETEDDETEED